MVREGDVANSDLENVTGLALQAKTAAEARAREKADFESEKRRIEAAAIQALSTRLTGFAASLKGKVGVYVRAARGTYWPSIRVQVSTAPPWVRRPFIDVQVQARVELQEDGTLQPPVYIVSGIHPASSDNGPPDWIGHKSTIDAVVKALSLVAADFMNKRDAFEFVPPLWYFQVGAWCAWPLAAAAWLLCLLGGWIGFFLGWIPALIVYHVAKPTWPAFLAGGAWWAWK
jgi:hypothetical protein